MAKRVIAVDLDGTLAHYDGWKGIEHIGPVIPEVANAMERAQKEGADVWIFTARVSDPSDAEQAGKYVHDWLIKNNIKFEGITAVKHKFFTEFWDDRAIQVIKNTGEFVMYSDGTPMTGLTGHDHMAMAAETWYDHKTRVKLVLDSLNNEPDSRSESNNPLDVQEGGNHYKKYPIQPIVFCHANKIPPLESSIIKYVVRHKDKNGLEDLKKARHTIDILIKLDYNI